MKERPILFNGDMVRAVVWTGYRNAKHRRNGGMK